MIRRTTLRTPQCELIHIVDHDSLLDSRLPSINWEDQAVCLISPSYLGCAGNQILAPRDELGSAAMDTQAQTVYGTQRTPYYLA